MSGAGFNNVRPADPCRWALGTVQFGLKYGIANREGRTSLEEAKKVIGLSQAAGVDMLDTAIAYGDSEERLGRIGVEGWQVVSKLPAVPAECGDISEWVVRNVSESLGRLRIHSLYGLLLHRPGQLLEPGGDQLYLALQQLKREGIVGKIGISIYGPAELDAVLGRFPIDLVQAPFNIIDRRLIETGWLSRLADMGIEFHARSVFLQGLLLMDRRSRPAAFGRWDALWATWEEWLKESGITPLQACLRYALSFREAGKVVVGVDSIEQLKEVFLASAGPDLRLPDGFGSSDADLVNPANWPVFG